MEEISREKILKAFSFKKGGKYLLIYETTNDNPRELPPEFTEWMANRLDVTLVHLGVDDLNCIKFADLEKIKIKE